MAHARNARAARRALASSDTSSRRRTTRSRRYGNRGLTYVRANSAASSRVRTVTSRARRRGGSNTKSVMPRKLARGNRSSGTNLRHTQLADDFAPQRRLGLPNGYGTAAAGGFNYAPAVRIWLGVFPVQRLNACVNALTS